LINVRVLKGEGIMIRKILTGLGIAIILPLLVHYGVSSIVPSPNTGMYQIEKFYSSGQAAKTPAKTTVHKKHPEAPKKISSDHRRFRIYLFAVAVPVGLVAIIIGSLVPIMSIGQGLIFGGILTIVDGYAYNWVQMFDWFKFLSLLVALVVIILIEHRKHVI
jgi:hypothetical protein